MSKSSNNIRPDLLPSGETEGGFPLLAFTFGMASIVGQVALLREFMSLFSGHEIIIGLFLSFWMLLTGAGAFVGGKVHKRVGQPVLPVAFGISFIFAVLALYLLRTGFVVHGAEPEFVTLVVVIFITLLPVCITSGYAFVRYASAFYQTEGRWSVSKIYVWEQLGSSVGGGLLYLLLVQWFDSVRMITVVVFILFLIAGLVAVSSSKRKVLYGVVMLVAGVFFLKFPLQKMLRSLEFGTETIVSIEDTPYGNVVMTSSGEQLNIYENGNLRSYSGDVEVREESVHAVMLRHPAPHKILMIGGATSGTFGEFQKYGDTEVDYVDSNPAIVELLKPEGNERIHLHVKDPFRFLKDVQTKYDVIILNSGLPFNLQENRCFTKEYFGVARSKLKSGGMIGIKGPAKQFHKEDSYLRYLSIIASTGLSVFSNYDIYPGNFVWFVFSDVPVKPLFDERNAGVMSRNVWFNSDYILPDLLEDERQEYVDAVKLNMPVNSCLKPVLLEQSIDSKSDYWHIDRFAYIYIVVGIFIVAFLFFKRRAKVMAVAGFALSGVQLLLIYLLQIVAGNVYEMIGAVFALSMAGMALGGWLHRKFLFRLSSQLPALLLISGVMILLLPFVMRVLVEGGVLFVLQVFTVYLLVLLFSFSGGVIFSVVSFQKSSDVGKMAGSVYGADLTGASAGMLLTSLFLIPVAGMTNTAFVLGALSVIGGLMIFRG